jgi:hypothetical protein
MVGLRELKNIYKKTPGDDFRKKIPWPGDIRSAPCQFL